MIGLVVLVLSQWPSSLTVTQTTDVHGEQQLGRRTVKLSRITVAEPAAVVLEKFLESFRAARLYVPPPEDQLQLYPGKTTLTALDPRSGKTFTVTFWAEGKGTEVLLGQSALMGQTFPGSDALKAMLPKSAESVLHTRDERWVTCSFTTPLGPEALRAELEKNARALGGKLEASEQGFNVTVPGTRFTVSFKAGGAVLRVLMMEQLEVAP